MPTFIYSAPSAPVSFDVLYVKMLPHFRFFAKRVMRLKADNFDDAVQEMTAIAYEMYRSLVRRGKEVYYTPLMKFAAKRYRAGRRFIGTSTVDVLAEHTRMLGRCEVFSLEDSENTGTRYLARNRRENVADTVQFKIDFYDDWLQQQTPRDQEIIKALSYGHTTGDVAKKYKVSAGLISQYRRRYSDSWDNFIADKRESA